MRQSQLFYKTEKEESRDVKAFSHKLLIRAGFIDQLAAGIYTFLPLGFKVLRNIEDIIRKKMVEPPLVSQEILMPALTPKENWQKTGRWNNFDALFRLKGGGNKDYALGPTHEEIISPLVKKFVFSYRDLPLSLFQIQTKFRNEIRVKSGLLRTREFVMKDLYSFHTNEQDLENYYKKAGRVYMEIFEKCGVASRGKEKITYKTLASGGTFSKYSHEYQTTTDSGEDIIYICQKCNLAVNKEIKNQVSACPECGGTKFKEKKSVEVGNIFKLGTKYSLPFNLKFRDKTGEEKPVVMGCYGIGLGRLMAAIVEVNHDDKGIIWPKGVSPFQVHLIPIENTKKVKEKTEKIYQDLSSYGGSTIGGQKKEIEVLYDDRKDKTAGEKFAEADLIGIPYRVVISEKTLSKNAVELKERKNKSVKLVEANRLAQYLKC